MVSSENLISRYDVRIRELQAMANHSETNLSDAVKVGASYRSVQDNETDDDIRRLIRPRLAEDAAFVELLVSSIFGELAACCHGKASGSDRGSDSDNYYSVWKSTGGDRAIRIIFPSGAQAVQEALSDTIIKDGNSDSTPLECVCFLGERLAIHLCKFDDHEIVRACWDADSEIVSILDASVVLAYSTAAFENGGDWGNVVLFRRGKSTQDFTNGQNADAHSNSVRNVAPRYYSQVRIHRCRMNPFDMHAEIYRTLFLRYFDCGEGGGIKQIRRVVLWDDEYSGKDIASTSPSNGVDCDGPSVGSSHGSVHANEGYASSAYHLLAGAIEAELDVSSQQNPVTLPSGYTFIAEEHIYNAAIHLEWSGLDGATVPSQSLLDLGYSEKEVDQFPSAFGQSQAFQILSAPGIDALRSILCQLDVFSQSSPRIPKVLRGAAFRSKFVRDLCACPRLCYSLSKLAGCSLAPHPMTIMHGHTNLTPDDTARRLESIDKWHRDTVAFVLVIFISDPSDYEGGQFQYFAGTCEEAEAFLEEGSLPQSRILSIGEQAPGSAVFQQGWRVYHRAARVSPTSKERTTFVLSYVACDAFKMDACYSLAKTYNEIDPDFVLLPDWVRFRCWKAQRAILLGLRTFNGLVQEHFESGLLSDEHWKSITSIRASALDFRMMALAVVKRLPFSNNRLAIASTLLRCLKALQILESYLEAVLVFADRLRVAVRLSIETVKGAVSDVESFEAHKSSMVYFL